MQTRQLLQLSVVVVALSLSGFPAFLVNTVIPPKLPTSYFSLDAVGPHPTGNRSYESILVTGASAEFPFKFCEDATEWAREDKVLLSCDANRLNFNTVMGPLRDPTPRGSLWILDPSPHAARAEQVELVGFPATSNFHPLGVDILSDESSTGDILFVVNHQKDVSTVELFSLVISPDDVATATYLRTISHRSFTGAPNSVLPISPTSFYLTHDHHFNRRSNSVLGAFLNFVETIGALLLGRVDFISFEGDAVLVETVAKGIAFANGAAMSHSGTEVAIASSTHRRVFFYRRNVSTNALTHFDTVQLPFAVDNLSTAPASPGKEGLNSTYIAAGHPYYFSLLAASRRQGPVLSKIHAMSWVVAIKPRTDDSDDEHAPYPSSERAKKSTTREVSTLYQSSGGDEEGAFGMSTTGVYGLSKEGVPYLVIPGLYSEGVQVVRGTSLK